jgi:hypothetical protein
MPFFPVSGGRAWTEVDEEDSWRFEKFHYNLKNVSRVDGSLRQYAWHDVIKPSPDGLPVRDKSGRKKMKRHFLHVEILVHKLGRPIRKGYMTDHADKDGMNNRRSNLRELTNGQNVANQRKRSKATSQYLGVSKHPCGRWQVQVKKDKKPIPLGLFDTQTEAAQYKKAAARFLYPESNSPGKPQPAHIVERVKRILFEKGFLADA